MTFVSKDRQLHIVAQKLLVTHIMLLDNLLEAGIVQLRELRKIMDIRDDVAQVLL